MMQTSQQTNQQTGQHTTGPTRLGAVRRAAAFSLIEVLVAILILALGLLGLGAVIPVVVREQRLASESTRAVIAANNAAAYLRSRPDLNRLVGDGGGSRGGGGGPSMGGASAVRPMGFGVWLEDVARWSKNDLWVEAKDLWEDSYKGSGDLRIRGQGQSVTIPMVDRLWPDPSSGAEPVLVWDFWARRVTPGGSVGQPRPNIVERTLEIAVFVRRIDPAIRVGPGRTRLQVLTDPRLPPTMRRLPISVDPDTGPTGDGRTPADDGEYSLPMILEVAISPRGQRDRIILNTDGSADAWVVDAAARPGQKIIDNHGNVYTVLRQFDDASDIEVQVTPAIPSTLSGSDFQKVVFTPQIPAAVEVFRITLPVSPVHSPNGSGAGMVPWFGGVGEES